MIRPEAADYQGHRVVGARLAEPVLDDEIGFHSSERERLLLPHYHALDRAQLVMLVERGLVTRTDGVSMAAGLRRFVEPGIEAGYISVGAGMHSGEVALIAELGEEVGGRLEIGRASGEVVQVAWRRMEAAALRSLLGALGEARAAILEVAAAHTSSVMPGYTHSQHAQVVTLAHVLLAWEAGLARCFARGAETHARVNWSAAGSGNMSGSDAPLDRARTAELLGFDGALDNTYDAIQHNDHAIECLGLLATLGSLVTRWAQDLYLYGSQEVAILDLPDRFCGTSALMPQKKNPRLLEYLQGASASALGGLATALMVEKTPSGGAIVERTLFVEALARGFREAERNLGWLALAVSESRWDLERMRSLARAHGATASTLAAALARERGWAWRTAHEVVGTAVRIASERGVAAGDLTPALLDEASELYCGRTAGLSAESVASALDPLEAVRRHALLGGPAPEESIRLLPERRAALARDRERLSQLTAHAESAAQALDAAFDRVARGEPSGRAMARARGTGVAHQVPAGASDKSADGRPTPRPDPP